MLSGTDEPIFTPKELKMLRHAKIMDALYGGEPRIVAATDGRSVRELRQEGFTCHELVASSAFTIRELRLGSVSASELRAVGVSVNDCRPFTISELRAGGYPASEMRAACRYTTGELVEGGYTASELRTAAFDSRELKNVGVPLVELKEAGYTGMQLRIAGYAAKKMRTAGFSVVELREAGYTASQVLKAGVPVEACKAAGYTAAELRAAGVSVLTLKAAGFTTRELLAQRLVEGTTTSEKEPNPGGCCTVNELLEAGFAARELNEGGADLDDMFGGKTGVDAVVAYRAAGIRAIGLREEIPRATSPSPTCCTAGTHWRSCTRRVTRPASCLEPA